MADYYAYLIGIDGRVSKRIPVVYDDDEEAKRFAKPNGRWPRVRAMARKPQDRDVRTSCTYGRRGRQRLLGGRRRDGRFDESI